MSVQPVKWIKYGILLFYLALFTVLGLYDERPDPDLAREMARPLPEALEPGNAWIAFLGFSAPAGMSPYTRGEGIVRALRAAVMTGRDSDEFCAYLGNFKPELSFKGKMPVFSGKKEGGILAYARAHPAETAALIRDNGELLRRYESLRVYPRYTESLNFGYCTPIPRFSPLLNAQKTVLLRLASRAGGGDVAGALAGVREDADFWRSIARNSGTLISKLIALSALNTDLRFAAELGAYSTMNASELGIVRQILRPFDTGEIAMAPAMRGEVRYGLRGMELSTWRKMKKWSPEKLVFKRNATDNRMYANSRDFIRLAELPPQQFAEELGRREAEKTGTPRIGIPFLYNSTGEILAIIGIPSWAGYIEKGHDLEGLRRLSLLKVIAHQEQVPSERMRQFLSSHARSLGNPYTGAPMTWDPVKGSISFMDASGKKLVEIF